MAINTSRRVHNRIKKFAPSGKLDHTALLYRALAAISHPHVLAHTDRVALICEKVARKMKKDPKAAFFAGLLHDFGKIVLPHQLFDEHDISAQEYALIKSHSIAGFEALKDLHLFTALCAGLHHSLYHHGYGLTVEDFPKNWTPPIIRKVLGIATIVSICDFIDAYSHRKTKLRHSPSATDKAQGMSLRDLLLKQYPDDEITIDIALKVNQEFLPEGSAQDEQGSDSD